MDAPPDHQSTRKVGQACDRCRKKKIKCDGTLPACRNCVKADKSCESSARLQRNTRVRGFVSDDTLVQELQNQLAECQQKLHVERETSAILRQQLAQLDPSTVAGQSAYPADTSLQTPFPTSNFGTARPPEDPAFVIKHMGRMVLDETGVGRFAGSTTGVHFVLSVEKECQQTLDLVDRFPESCYRLHLAQPPYPEMPISSEAVIAPIVAPVSPGDSLEEQLRYCLSRPLDFYIQQIDDFIRSWGAFCPVVVKTNLVADVHALLSHGNDYTPPLHIDHATLSMISLIVTINRLTKDIAGHSDARADDSRQHARFAAALQDRVVARGDIKCLQVLVLFSFYHQLSGKRLSLVRLNGVMVRIAHSLGLHRHARRFRMKPGEVELRKRLWWWIYSFDRIASVVHGLPPLISDDDVDNDMPVDCHLDDLDAAELSHPLPGETTGVFFFNQYVQLGKKISSILRLLYTTTQRRDGVSKIDRLERDLRVWSQNLSPYDYTQGLKTSSTTHLGSGLMIYWLHLLTNLVAVLIHRPGLTFNDDTEQFASCMTSAVRSCREILHLLRMSEGENYLRNLCPIGPALVFQCALMDVYFHCKSSVAKLSNASSLSDTLATVSTGVEILQMYMLDGQFTVPKEFSPESFYYRSISEAIATLQRLVGDLQSREPQPYATGPPLAEDLETPFDPQSWSGNALEELNYMTSMDWIHGLTDPFGHLPHLGG